MKIHLDILDYLKFTLIFKNEIFLALQWVVDTNRTHSFTTL